MAFACAAALAMVLEGHPEGCHLVHELGGLPPLTQMLSGGGAQAKRAAAEVLQALAAEHMPLKTEIAAAGAVPLLVSLLRQGERCEISVVITSIVTVILYSFSPALPHCPPSLSPVLLNVDVPHPTMSSSNSCPIARA